MWTSASKGHTVVMATHSASIRREVTNAAARPAIPTAVLVIYPNK